MKAITLWQPWAQLVAAGVKTIETRSWSTRYRGPLAIHAAATKKPMRDVWAAAIGHQRPAIALTNALDAALGWNDWRYATTAGALPYGAVVATATLFDVVPVGDLTWATEPGWRHEYERNGADSVEAIYVGRDQEPYGDFTEGRWAWLLADVHALPEPIPARGRQQLFYVDLHA